MSCLKCDSDSFQSCHVSESRHTSKQFASIMLREIIILGHDLDLEA